MCSSDLNREVKKGDVLSVARVAGIQAAKRTADMIPLCHPLLVGSVSVTFDIGDDHVVVEVYVETVDRTGVEMEALHACATAALTIYDMSAAAHLECSQVLEDRDTTHPDFLVEAGCSR